MQDDLTELGAERDRFLRGGRAPSTIKAYKDSYMRFCAWCLTADREPLPASADSLSLWAVSMLSSGLRVATVEARLSGVAHAHKEAGLKSPIAEEVRRVLVGARRVRKENTLQKRALTVGELWKITRVIDCTTSTGLRDRALIVFGFAGAFRRSELSSLDLADVTFAPKGLLVHLRWSKTDQMGKGRNIGLWRGENADTCPVRTMQAWLKRRGMQPGPLFYCILKGDTMTDRRLSADNCVRAVKNAIAGIGLDSHQYGGHSLRSGYVTAAAENGASTMAIMQQTGHKSIAMVHRYMRPVTAFGANALAGKL